MIATAMKNPSFIVPTHISTADALGIGLENTTGEAVGGSQSAEVKNALTNGRAR